MACEGYVAEAVGFEPSAPYANPPHPVRNSILNIADPGETLVLDRGFPDKLPSMLPNMEAALMTLALYKETEKIMCT